ncbi:GerAB/ArcD/ProY family transporter [Brevibacillus dissolubilis]|uniref:GerAB/ArcD/ProY family transporter n=1 Tax=Brevibacillus dissolubilis TaxID=1844116 RepID=UPI00159BDA19|nr:GerAB/ArcD/ProY family transporter [Brevibacillus dissolubilis]
MGTRQADKISRLELFFFILQSVIGIGILSLPYTVFSESKTDAWIAVLLAGIAITINMMINWKLSSHFPSANLFDFLPTLLGKYLSKAVSVGYIVYFLAVAYLVLLLFGDIITRWVLPRTPVLAIYFLLVSTSIYLARESLSVITRFCVIVSIFLPVLLILMLVPLNSSHFIYIFPIGQTGLEAIFKGAKETSFSIIGYELLLVIYPFVKGNHTQIRKVILLSSAFLTLFYTFLVFNCVIFFSSEELEQIPEPILYMLKSFSFRVIERIDLLFLSIWIVTVLTTFVNYLFAASIGIKQLFHQNDHRHFTLAAGFLCLLCAEFTGDRFLVQKISDFLAKASFLFVAGIPLLLLLIIYMKKLRWHGR